VQSERNIAGVVGFFRKPTVLKLISKGEESMKKNIVLLICGLSMLLVMLTVSSSFSKGTFGSDVNSFCQDTNPYTGDCLLCHTADSKGDPHPGKTAYKIDDYCYFCENDTACIDPAIDNDGDGYDSTVDCNDNNASINPGATEDCSDGIDNDCDNLIDTFDPNAVGCQVDNDGDGYDSTVDCNDNNASINPGATEDCTDGIDNDCDNLVDLQDPSAEGCPLACTDNDLDTYNIEGGECGTADCNDFDAGVNPASPENCTDGIDNDCDNKTDCDDSACVGDSACLADFCIDYNDRRSCKSDPRCNWNGKAKSCDEIPEGQLVCQENGGRWNTKKETCTIR
jgi:hypothetical protein